MTALRRQTGSSGLNFDARRWTWFDAIAGTATVTLLFSLFDPWYDIRFAGCPGGLACRADNRLGKLSGIVTPLALLTVSWQYGAWMAVTAATVAVIAAVLNLARPRPSP